MFILRVFPLSLAILWRFIFVLPLWTIFYIALTVLSFYGVISLLGSIPVVGIVLLLVAPFLAMVISYIISMHPYLIGIRIGLRVLGVKTEASQKRMFGAAVGYGLVEGVIAYLFSLAIFAVSIILIKSELVQYDPTHIERVADPMAELSRQIAYGRLTILSVVSSVAAMALRATVLPALASAAAGRDPNKSRHTLLDGLGTSFTNMVLLLLMITGISTLAIPLMGDAINYIGLTNVLTNQLSSVVQFAIGEQDFSFTFGQALVVCIAIVLSIWLFCLQCAGAALSYESRLSQTAKRWQPDPVVEQNHSQDIAALRRSRMTKPPK